MLAQRAGGSPWASESGARLGRVLAQLSASSGDGPGWQGGAHRETSHGQLLPRPPPPSLRDIFRGCWWPLRKLSFL